MTCLPDTNSIRIFAACFGRVPGMWRAGEAMLVCNENVTKKRLVFSRSGKNKSLWNVIYKPVAWLADVAGGVCSLQR